MHCSPPLHHLQFFVPFLTLSVGIFVANDDCYCLLRALAALLLSSSLAYMKSQGSPKTEQTIKYNLLHTEIKLDVNMVVLTEILYDKV